MQRVIISDASCLILLDKIGFLNILQQLFGTIVTTDEVASEFGSPLPQWISVIAPSNKNYQSLIEISVDRGEASAIALALEFSDSLLIIDELKGRRYAIQLGLKITGTLGILIEAKELGHINSVKPILEKIKQTNFRMSAELEALVLRKAGE